MDVGGPSNFERLYALHGDGLRDRVTGQSVDDAATLARMRDVYERLGYVACPHTAVALEAFYRERARGREGPAPHGPREARPDRLRRGRATAALPTAG